MIKEENNKMKEKQSVRSTETPNSRELERKAISTALSESIVMRLERLCCYHNIGRCAPQPSDVIEAMADAISEDSDKERLLRMSGVLAYQNGYAVM